MPNANNAWNGNKSRFARQGNKIQSASIQDNTSRGASFESDATPCFRKTREGLTFSRSAFLVSNANFDSEKVNSEAQLK
jgi:hypothetical protein